jgi:hypothetical protein
LQHANPFVYAGSGNDAKLTHSETAATGKERTSGIGHTDNAARRSCPISLCGTSAQAILKNLEIL